MKATTKLIAHGALAASVLSTAPGVLAQDTDQAQNLVPQGARIAYHEHTGLARFLALPAEAGTVARSATGQAGAAAERAFANLQRYGPLFGIEEPGTAMALSAAARTVDGRDIVRYTQRYRGLPVLAGELIVNMDRAGRLASMSGEVSPALALPTAPAVTAEEASENARIAVAHWHGLEAAWLQADPAVLSIYDPKLLHWRDWPAKLVWRVDVRGRALHAINELVLVDAMTGVISLHFNQVHAARNRETYDANGTSTLPGTLVCDESQPDCTNGADPDADAAHTYAGDTYDFYLSRHGRDSLDNAGGTLISTVNFDSLFICPNAFWADGQMVYCTGFAQADDVVAHELTHGVTEFTSNLFYYYQSGAINESLSDIWGEFVDLTNSGGNDSDSVRWLIGEDLPIGAIRDMRNPQAAPFFDPDKISSPNYFTGPADNGGVHSNSGVNNKAVYLMTDGDTFNGYTVAGLGIDKVAAIYYEAQTNLLTTGADYADLYDALNQACANLTGTAGISAGDCDEVRKAALAVEMNAGNIPGFNPEAPLCDGNVQPTDLFFDDMENGTANWDFVTLAGGGTWTDGAGFATSGTQALWDQNQGGFFLGRLTDLAATLNRDIALPAGTRPYLHFRHAFAFEFAGSTAPDGGFVQYSTDGGTTWNDAGDLMDAGQAYNGVLSEASDNPNGGQAAFVSESRGYVSTRLDLSDLAGQSVRFRWRSTSNPFLAGPLGWVLDDVRVHQCGGAAPLADAGEDQTVLAGADVTLDGGNSSDPDGFALSYDWMQTAGPSVSLGGANTARPSFTAPSQGGDLSFSLTVTDADGFSDTDAVTVTVNEPPTADAGPDQSELTAVAVTLDGSASNDPEAGPLSFAWIQVGGTPVTLSGADTAMPSFTTPLEPQVLTFELSVTDDLGAQSTDQADVTVLNRPPVAAAGADVTVTAGASVNLDGSASSDPEGSALSFAWSQLTGTPIALTQPDAPTSAFTAPPSADAIDIELTVTDQAGASDSDTVSIQVVAPPTADAGADRTVSAGAAVTLDGSGSAAAAGRSLSYAWQQTAGSAVALSGATAAAASFTAPAAAAALTFQLTVTDDLGGSHSDSVIIGVQAQSAGDDNDDSERGTNSAFNPWLALVLAAACLGRLRRLRRIQP